MGNETSDSSTSSSSVGSANEEVENQDNEFNDNHVYRPSLYTGVYGMYHMKFMVASKVIYHEPLVFDNYEFIPFGHFQVNMYISYFVREYALNMKNTNDDISEVCGLYFGNEIERFDTNKKGPRCTLNELYDVCTLSHNGCNTVYGTMCINQNPQTKSINAYKWTFKIIRKKLNIFIGIDSNPSFARSDFSNYFRNFTSKHSDIFCSLGSDGNIYHYMSRDAFPYSKTWTENDEIAMIVDVQSETLSYCINGEHQSIAMSELSLGDKEYFMAVSMFYEQDAIELLDFSVSEKYHK